MKTIEKNHFCSEIGYHIVFCTKYRNSILNQQIQVVLKQLITEICIEYEWTVHALEIMEDHIHLFVQTEPTVAPTDIVKTIKSITAVKIFTLFPKLKQKWFWGSGLWSRGYYVGTCGTITNETVKRYIENQKIKN